ncbi:Flp family type IVb pilin [Sphingomonas albertensis]|uniref:Flp family type IVb pilin n=1 Tax=Sphingomonas albertensis TaxID=2762591 RepID=A0ABR7AP68_9SPHN|nr:Flp family type IVb pilin [Sphingomonas albertensis]MBC3942250.1 Flp family type IVb pilin [Sphingomonas albertensis]
MRPRDFATSPIIRTIARALRQQRGATAIEYGLILALMVIAMIVGLTALANSTTGMWNTVDTKVSAAR